MSLSDLAGPLPARQSIYAPAPARRGFHPPDADPSEQLWTPRVENDYYPRMQINKLPSPALRTASRAHARPIAVITALACAALISACGSSSSTTSTAKTNVNTARVAASIEQSVLQKRHLHATVVCPSAVPQEKGKKFECVATIKSPKGTVTKTPFAVTVQNNAGYVTYEGK
jgi:hypothetical protein